MIKGIERVTSMLNFKLRGVEGWLHGMRQDSPPRMTSIDYELIVDTEEPDQRLELLYTNVRKYGTTPILEIGVAPSIGRTNKYDDGNSYSPAAP